MIGDCANALPYAEASNSRIRPRNDSRAHLRLLLAGTIQLGRATPPHPNPLPRGEGGRSGIGLVSVRSAASVVPLLGERARVRGQQRSKTQPSVLLSGALL